MFSEIALEWSITRCIKRLLFFFCRGCESTGRRYNEPLTSTRLAIEHKLQKTPKGCQCLI